MFFSGAKATVFVGSVLFCLGPMLTALTINTRMWYVVFTYGIISSMGQNIAILPTLNLPMAWFPKKRGLISGIVVSGFGFGAFVFNQVQTLIVNPNNLGVDEDGYFGHEEILLQVPALLLYLGLLYGSLLFIGE